MSSSKRREEEKRRREKYLAKRKRAGRNLGSFLQAIQHLSDIPVPRSWPGVADPSLNRPDLIKFELGTFAQDGTGRDLGKQLERQLKQGLLGFIPELDHWGMEEFFWHGLPGNPWHPIDEFLNDQGDRFPAAARMQLARWKDARIGCYEVGEVADDTVSLREVDVVSGRPVGTWVRAIALNIGGVNVYGPEKGKLNLTYLAPWSPEENIFCAMGYGLFVPVKQRASCALLVRGLRSIQAVTFPLPWRAGKIAARQCLEQWRDRDWYQFMVEHVRCPFEAVAMTNEFAELCTISGMLTATKAESEYYGFYFEMDDDEEKMACGATGIIPLDFDSPNALAFAEYREFRHIVGPPPASRGRV